MSTLGIPQGPSNVKEAHVDNVTKRRLQAQFVSEATPRTSVQRSIHMTVLIPIPQRFNAQQNNQSRLPDTMRETDNEVVTPTEVSVGQPTPTRATVHLCGSVSEQMHENFESQTIIYRVSCLCMFV